MLLSHRDFSGLLEVLGLLFQIRDDYANLSSDEVCVCYVLFVGVKE